MKIVVVCGTNRDGSLTRLLSKQVATICQDLADEVDLIDMNEIDATFLNPKAYKEPEGAVSSLVDRFLTSDGAIFVIPEYNGSYPGILKLFVDMLPYPQGFDSRPCAFVGLSAGQFKALRAVEHFQQVAGYRNAYIYPRRVFIGDSFKQFDFEKGCLKDEELAERLRKDAAGFVTFVKTMKAIS